MPRHKMAGCIYSDTLFCHSVILKFPFIILATVAHIHLIFDMWICHRNMQVKFELRPGLMIFDKVMLLELRKKEQISSFCFLSFEGMYMYMYIVEIAIVYSFVYTGIFLENTGQV